jgi:hypothetical protein
LGGDERTKNQPAIVTQACGARKSAHVPVVGDFEIADF